MVAGFVMHCSTKSVPRPFLGRRLSPLVLTLVATSWLGCDTQEQERALPIPVVNSATPQPGQSGKPTLPKELSQQEAPQAPEAEPEPPPHPGPWLVITSSSTGLYEEPKFDKEAKFGYARNGGRLAVLGEVVSKAGCSGGWYQLVGGGYVCGNSGTIDDKSDKLKFVQKAPDLEEVLPYKYARNAKNGTPLYRSIPSREQMHQYEPYLKEAKKKQDEAESDADADAKKTKRAEAASGDQRKVDVKSAASERSPGPANAGTIRVSDSSLPSQAIFDETSEPEPEPEVPWWQAEDAKDRLHEVTLEQLQDEADGVLAKRMVTGFYVAVDKTFNWHGRLWYKTTKGLVAPADRFWQTRGSKFKGAELGDDIKLPLAWVVGVRKSATKYRIDDAADTIKPDGNAERFDLVELTGETRKYRGTDYHETKDGLWVKSRFLRVTEPGDVPAELKPGERWIDVNLSRQTLVAFEGETPKYATLISSGKKSSIKAKDHRTPTGRWRVRVKHVTDTMDGDGTAAGDLPYSIEDVPYVMYFHKSYALHAAFWHANYGVEMSHGCINLAPLDAKHLFFFAGPELTPGSHGVWSSENRPGSLIQVHE